MAIFFKAGPGSGGCRDCDCPDEPCDGCCDPPSIKCDSVSVEKGKQHCGYLNPDDGKIYRTQVRSQTLDYSFHEPSNPETPVFCDGVGYVDHSADFFKHGTIKETITRSCDEENNVTETITYEGTYFSTEFQVTNGVTVYSETIDTSITDSSSPAFTGTRTVVTRDCATGEEIDSYTEPSSEGMGGFSEGPTYEDLEDYPLSRLEGEAMEDMPEFPGTFAGTCVSSRDVSDDEEVIALAHAKAKFFYLGALPSNKRVAISYKIVFTPEDGGAATETPGTTSIEAGESESEEIDIPIPDVDGEATIEIEEATCETIG